MTQTDKAVLPRKESSMNKSAKKLTIRRETIRLLQDLELTAVQGGVIQHTKLMREPFDPEGIEPHTALCNVV